MICIDTSPLMPQGCPNQYLSGLGLSDVCIPNQHATPLLLFMLNTVVGLHPKIGDPCGRVRPVKQPDRLYDFIVVGGGAAGPAVAARLSEVPEWNVLLIEAGPDEPAESQVPSNLQLFLNTDLDWKYRTTNESHACLRHNGSCSWPRGKNLGGCTTHHGMAYHRGYPMDYDKWAEMGNTGWSYKEVLPYFMKSEDNKEIGRVSKKYHGRGGPNTVERFRWQPEFAWDILEAAREKDFGVTEDFTGDAGTGFTVAQTISRDGVRLSSAAAYLRPNRDRPNLHVALNATVTKILIKNSKAIGVKYIMNGQSHTAKVKREVILSAGSVNSPQLLLLSGIGPAEHLKSVDIPVVHDLPGVGFNLHNHVSFALDYDIASDRAIQLLDINCATQYLLNQTGPMSSTGLAQVSGVLPSSHTNHQWPDMQIFVAGYQDTCVSKTGIADLPPPVNNTMSVRFTAVNLHPASRGRISLKTKDPLSPPIIWSNDLAEYTDASVLVEGVRVILSLVESKALQKHGLKLKSKPVKECSEFAYDSNDYWRCAIHWETRTENHQSGSCKMGPSSDPMAVVDPRLRVHGIKGLRVADASVMPRVVSGNPVAPIVMIGERAADFIKADYSKPTLVQAPVAA